MGSVSRPREQRLQVLIIALAASLLALTVSVIGAAELIAFIKHRQVWYGLSIPVLAGVLAWLALCLTHDLPTRKQGAPGWGTVTPVVKEELFWGGLLLGFLGLTGAVESQITFVSAVMAFCILARAAARILVRYGARGLGLNTLPRVVIVGSGQVGQLLAASLMKYESGKTQVLAFVDSLSRGQSHAEHLGLPIYGPRDLAWLIESQGANLVVFAFSSLPDGTLVKLLQVCRSYPGVRVGLVPRFYQAMTARARLLDVHGVQVLSVPVDEPSIDALGKQLCDRLLAALGLLLVAPLLLLAALVVRLEGPGPVFFSQQRVGVGGKLFSMYKLRSMREPKLGEDVNAASRYTRVGAFLRKWSIDELPQLWNVLRGEMSLVGPRPERPEYVQLFSQQIRGYDRRHTVRGGLTGLAQVKGLRGATSIVERTRLDIFYAEHRNLWLDLKILVHTLTALMPTSQGIGGELMFLDLVSEVARDRAAAKPAVRETEGPITEPAPMAPDSQHPDGDGKRWTVKTGERNDEAIGPTIVVA